MKAVSSIYHQLVRYPTPTRTVNNKGDEVVTTSISIVIQKKSGCKSKTVGVVLEESLSEKKKLS